MSSIPETTRQWVLERPPTGSEKDIYELFNLVEKPLFNKGEVQDVFDSPGKVLVKTKYLSNDPTQKVWMLSNNKRSYIPPIQPGQPMRALGIGEVVKSSSESFSVGDHVFSSLNWSSYNLFDNPSTSWLRGLTKIPPSVHPVDYLALSVSALAAHIGLLHCGQPKPTDKIVVVSAAAGATGSIVVQIAKKVLGIEKVIGIAGGPDKCKIIKDIGADFAVDYKSSTFKEDFSSAIGSSTIDIYFDNVGGSILDLALHNMSKYGRIVACGAISTYNDVTANSGEIGVSAVGWANIVTHSLTVKGFVLSHCFDKVDEATRDLYKWYGEGKVKPLTTVWKAKLEEVPTGLEKLFRGDNVGKLVTQLEH